MMTDWSECCSDNTECVCVCSRRCVANGRANVKMSEQISGWKKEREREGIRRLISTHCCTVLTTEAIVQREHWECERATEIKRARLFRTGTRLAQVLTSSVAINWDVHRGCCCWREERCLQRMLLLFISFWLNFAARPEKLEFTFCCFHIKTVFALPFSQLPLSVIVLN